MSLIFIFSRSLPKSFKCAEQNNLAPFHHSCVIRLHILVTYQTLTVGHH
jgi:hypothetical protein